jgi:hypothetical protein
MPININDNNLPKWKSITRGVINIGGTWKSITRGVINIAGTWKELLFGAPTIAQQVEISQETDLYYNITLTGTNYHWLDYDSSIYVFQKSTNSGSTWSDINTGTILNPSSGSSNTKSYLLTSITPNVANLYRFKVTTTSSSGQESSSTSDTTTVQAPRNISNLAATSTTSSSITLGWTPSQYADSQIIQYREVRTSTWIGFGTYSGSTSSKTVTGLNAATQYAFRIIPYTGPSGNGYSGNASNTTTEYTQQSQLACYPKLTCGNLIYTTDGSQPVIGSTAGSPCYVSSVILQYKYYQNEAKYACDTPVSVSGLYSPCPGCGTYSVLVSTTTCTDVTTYWCKSRTYTRDNQCIGPEYISYNNLCPEQGQQNGDYCGCRDDTALSCSALRTTTNIGTCNSQRCGSSCSPFTVYSCPSGYGSPYLQGGRYYCTGTTTPFATIFATATTNYSYLVNETINVKKYRIRGPETVTDCNATPYVVSNLFSPCPGCGVYSTTEQVCNTSSYTDYRCDSRLYYTCTAGPYYSSDNPTYTACNSNLISTYNYKLYSQTCDNFITYYANSPTDPICQGCPTSVLP